MGKKRDYSFKTYVWSQFQSGIVRSKILRSDPDDGIEEQDSDIDQDAPSKKIGEWEDEYEITENFIYEPINVQINDKDFMYYIKKKNGKCYIFEGNPRDQYLKKH